MGQDQSRLKNGQAGAAAGSVNGGSGAAALPAAGVAGSQGSAVATVPLAGIEGFQIVRLLPFSPAHAAGLVPYFDIVTSLDHVLLESEGKPALQFFKSYIANHRDQPVCFTVYNLHIRAYRDVYCVPSDAWGGGGLLGCSIEWSRAVACPERCVHVVDVLEGSPAARSGELKANRDYIIGMQTAQESLISLIKNQKDFYSRLEGWHEEQRWTLERKQRFPQEAVEVPHILLFLVYNSENNTVKEVAVEMGTNPEAALGMSVATGLLHIIPSAATAGDAATATALPVMNKFVRVEANRAITSTPEAPPPPTLTPPPAEHAQELQQQQQQQQTADAQAQQSHPGEEVEGSASHSFPPPSPPAEPSAPQEHPPVMNEAQEKLAVDPQRSLDGSVHESVSAPLRAPLSSTQPPLNHVDDSTAAPPPDYHASYPSAPPPPPPPPPPHPQQHMPSHPAYPMPPSIPDNFIPPPRDDYPPSRHETPGDHHYVVPTPPAAAATAAVAVTDSHVPPPPPPQPHTTTAPAATQQKPPHGTSSARSTKNNSFRSALASVEAYEHRPSAAHPAAAPRQQLQLDQHAVLPPQSQSGSFSSPQQHPPHEVAEVAPPVVPPHTEPPVATSTPMRGGHEAAAPSSAPTSSSPPEPQAALAPPPPPPPQHQPPPQAPSAPQHPAFSMTNMPPPLNFPVFPGAALKRQQK